MAMYKDMNGRVVRAAPTQGFAQTARRKVMGAPRDQLGSALGQARATRVGAPSRVKRGY